jgi:hypothetical protein
MSAMTADSRRQIGCPRLSNLFGPTSEECQLMNAEQFRFPGVDVSWTTPPYLLSNSSI